MTNQPRLKLINIGVSLTQPDEDVARPSTKKAGSFQSQVEALSPTESCARIKKVGADNLTLGQIQAKLPDEREKLRNGLQPVIARARTATGGTYTTEVWQSISPAGDIYLVGMVTRTA
jgi:hypothetical protein